MPSKPKDAAVERLVRKLWKKDYHDRTMRIRRTWLKSVIVEARQSAARECAEIADNIANHIKAGDLTGAPAVEHTAYHIRKRFNLEATDAR